jgi:hypothetical protein
LYSKPRRSEPESEPDPNTFAGQVALADQTSKKRICTLEGTEQVRGRQLRHCQRAKGKRKIAIATVHLVEGLKREASEPV